MIRGNADDVYRIDSVLAQPIRQQYAVRFTLKAGVRGGVFTLAEICLRRPDRLVHLGAIGIGDAVHRPGIDKIRVLRKVGTRIDVPVLRGNDGVVLGLQRRDLLCNLVAAIGAKRAAWAKIVLDINDD